MAGLADRFIEEQFMARKKHSYVQGRFEHRRTEGSYMATLLESVTLDDWRDVVRSTMAAAKAGDASARGWLAQYLMGRPSATAPAPLTVVVQQLSGRDPLVERLAAPHVSAIQYPAMHTDDRMEGAIQGRVARELEALEVQRAQSLDTAVSADTARISAAGAADREGKLAK
jgi:hypothetical protein